METGGEAKKVVLARASSEVVGGWCGQERPRGWKEARSCTGEHGFPAGTHRERGVRREEEKGFCVSGPRREL